MAFPLTIEEITPITGAKSNFVATSWPLLESALQELGIGSNATCLATIATVTVECPPWHPVHEFGNAEYFTKHYEGRADLGNAVVGDGIKYAGRGFIQITGRRNYRNYGRAVGQDLEGNPDLALQPLVSAKILARYFKDHGVSTAADNADWVRVRKLVNGGTNGLAKFLQTEQELQDAEESQPPVPVDDKIAHHLSIIEKLLQLIHGKRS